MAKKTIKREYTWSLSEREKAASYAERWETRRRNVRKRSHAAKKAAKTRSAKKSRGGY